MAEVSQRSHLGHPSPEDVRAVDQELSELTPLLDPIQQKLHDHPGRKAEVSLRALFAYFLCNEKAENKTTLQNALIVGRALPPEVRVGWGDISPDPSYAQLHRLFTRFVRLHKGGNLGGEISKMDELFNRLFQAQLDATNIDFGSVEAADGTVFRTTARERFRPPNDEEKKWNEENGRDRNSKIPWTVDPDAALGHYPSKGGQTKFATGFEAHLTVPVPDGPRKMPIVVSSMTVQRNATTDRTALRSLAISRKHRIKTLIVDAGYDRKGEESFQRLHLEGIAIIFDPNKKLRQGKTRTHGALIIDGDLYCPNMPKRLRRLPDFAKNMAKGESAKLEALYDERDRYRFERKAYGPDKVRSMCPAQALKVKCTGVPVSLNNPRTDIPYVEAPEDRPKCCTQVTITTKTEQLRRSRQGHYAYGTSKWRRLYAQRNRAESYNADFRHNIGNFEERKWCAVMGRVKMTFMFGIKLLATNMRKIANFLADSS